MAAATTIAFATFAENDSAIGNARHLAASIRAFAGAHCDAPVRLYIPVSLAPGAEGVLRDLGTLGVEVHTTEAPSDSTWFFYARKVFAAAQAEGEAAGCDEILVWLDEDTVVLQEPRELLLPDGVSLGYRPVMHKNIGLLWDEPIDRFWQRAYERMSVAESMLFPVITPAHGEKLRTDINAGCLALRPERGLLRKWADCFSALYPDPALTEMCREDQKKRIFLHQVGLVGAIVTLLEEGERLELSGRYNYPIFFQRMFGARSEFDDLTDVVTLRHESYFRDPAPDWERQIRGPADRIAWLRENLVS